MTIDLTSFSSKALNLSRGVVPSTPQAQQKTVAPPRSVDRLTLSTEARQMLAEQPPLAAPVPPAGLAETPPSRVEPALIAEPPTNDQPIAAPTVNPPDPEQVERPVLGINIRV